MAHNLQNRRFVCQKFLIFSRKFRRSGTRSSISAICVPRIVHFSPSDVHKTEPSWHTKPDFTTLCAKVIRCPAERQRRVGTQNPILPLCVPKLSAARRRDSAGLAHKARFYHFVCQSYPLPGGETAPAWHTNLEKTDLCAKVIRCPAERRRPSSKNTAWNPRIKIQAVLCANCRQGDAVLCANCRQGRSAVLLINSR